MKRNEPTKKTPTTGRKRSSLKGILAETFELPKEIVLNMPKMIVIGNLNIFLENHKGLIEYGGNILRVNSGNGIICIEGTDIVIDEITSENLLVRGDINRISFDMR